MLYAEAAQVRVRERGAKHGHTLRGMAAQRRAVLDFDGVHTRLRHRRHRRLDADLLGIIANYDVGRQGERDSHRRADWWGQHHHAALVWECVRRNVAVGKETGGSRFPQLYPQPDGDVEAGTARQLRGREGEALRGLRREFLVPGIAGLVAEADGEGRRRNATQCLRDTRRAHRGRPPLGLLHVTERHGEGQACAWAAGEGGGERHHALLHEWAIVPVYVLVVRTPLVRTTKHT